MPRTPLWGPMPRNLNKYNESCICGPYRASAAEPRLPRQAQMPHPHAQASPYIATHTQRHPQAPSAPAALPLCCPRPPPRLACAGPPAQAAPREAHRVRFNGASAPARSCVVAGVFFPFFGGAAAAGAAAGGTAVRGVCVGGAAAAAGADVVAGFDAAGLATGRGRESK